VTTLSTEYSLRVNIDHYYADGTNQVALLYTSGCSGCLQKSTDSGRSFAGYENPRVFVDVCAFQGTYYGIEQSSRAVYYTTDAYLDTSTNTAEWFPLESGTLTPVNQITCDVSNGNLYAAIQMNGGNNMLYEWVYLVPVR